MYKRQAIFIPFITQELFQTGAALYYGLNALSNNMILCDRKQLKNPNGLILGTPGSGKSFAAKREMTNAFLITDDDIIICDPEAEYFSLVQRLDGQVIRLSPTGKGIDGKPQYVNPMDINLNYSEDDSPLALKSDFILSLCELVIGGKEGLQPVDKTVIDRAVRNVYRPFLADPDPEKMPILGDLYDELLKQPEPEAARIAAALELYVSGSLNVFNHRTNVELNNRLVCFDIKQLGKQLKKLGMLIVQDQVWNLSLIHISINFKKSMRYNPFAYIRSEKDILKLVNTIIANTKGDGEKSGEDFWVKAEKLYYTALIGYIWYEAPEDEKNFTTLLEMINACLLYTSRPASASAGS